MNTWKCYMVSSCSVKYSLPSLAASQPNSLPVFLQLRNQRVSLLDNVGVLLVLVVGPVRLNDATDSVYRAWYPVCSDEFGQVPTNDKY